MISLIHSSYLALPPIQGGRGYHRWLKALIDVPGRGTYRRPENQCSCPVSQLQRPLNCISGQVPLVGWSPAPHQGLALWQRGPFWLRLLPSSHRASGSCDCCPLGLVGFGGGAEWPCPFRALKTASCALTSALLVSPRKQGTGHPFAHPHHPRSLSSGSVPKTLHEGTHFPPGVLLEGSVLSWCHLPTPVSPRCGQRESQKQQRKVEPGRLEYPCPLRCLLAEEFKVSLLL